MSENQKPLRFKCIVLDHDDTIVNSTATIHYPSFVAYMEKYHPDKQMLSLEEYFRYNFDPGVIPLFRDILGMSEEELEYEQEFWAEYVKDHIPKAYQGMREILTEYRDRGGYIAISSHSLSYYILRDYQANDLPHPDLVYGWDMEPSLRKPAPFSLLDIMDKLRLKPDEMLMLDDLKPGYDMARSAEVPFAAAGWANDIPEIENFMRANCDYYFKTVREFGKFLLD